MHPYRLDRTLIRVSGADATPFLGNLLTQSLDALAEAGVLYGALLTPQGKVLCDMLLWADGEDVILETDTERGPDLLRRLGLYKLRAVVNLEDVSSERLVLWSATAFDSARVDPRFPDGELGWRKLVLGPPESSPAGIPAVQESQAAYDAHRLTLGVPDLARDAAPDEVFALEALLEEMHGVDFQKGCFVGQENVSRMKRRATTRKKFCPLAFDGAPPAFGAPVRAGDAEIGSVRTGAPGRAMAFLRLDRALEALHAGHALSVDGRAVRLDAPSWLILPQRAGEPD
jgi:tRNA-modifying protein YgfZ